MKKLTWFILQSALLSVLASAITWAQTGPGISGLVKDPSGAALSGATVTLVSQDNTVSLKTVSDSSGRYRFDHLAPNYYLLSATAKGLESSTVRSINTAGREQGEADLQLRLSAVKSSVTVTASGTAQTTDETAKSVSVIDSETMQAIGASTVTDALSYVPGLRITQLGGPGGLVSVKTRGLRNQDTSVLIDGFRVRDVTGTQGDASGLLQDLLITNTDRIEVLRGTGSSLYGTGATGGVINIITGMGGGETHGSVNLQGGSMGTFRGQANASGSVFGSRLGYSLGAAHLNVTRGLDGNLPARTTNAQGMFNYAVSDKTRIFGRMLFADSYGRMTQSPGAIVGDGTGVIAAVPLTGTAYLQYLNDPNFLQTYTGDATFAPDFTDLNQFRAARNYSGAAVVNTHPNDSFSMTVDYQGLATNRNYTNGPLGPSYQYDGMTHTVGLRLDWQVGKYQMITAGHEFENENSYNGDVEPDPANSFSTNATQRNQAIYVQDQLHLMDGRLQLAGSYRGQFFILEPQTFTPSDQNPYSGIPVSSPPAAHTYDVSAAYLFPQSGTKLRMHTGTGYRAPSLYERFGSYYGYGASSAYGYPGLKPERTQAVDGGIDQTFWNRRAVASATYFYTRLNQTIIFDSFLYLKPDPLNRPYGYANSSGGITRGVEASFAVSPIRQLNVLAAYTFVNAREAQPQSPGIYQTFAIPDHQFSLLATGQVTPKLAVVFGTVLSSTYLSPVFNNVTYMSQVFRFDGFRRGQAGVNYRMPMGEKRALKLFANVNNAFNQSYYESGYRTPGATAMSGLQFDF